MREYLNPAARSVEANEAALLAENGRVRGPVFVLALSPRTGSTWVQRMITATGECLVWGEHRHLLWFLDGWWCPEKDDGAKVTLHRFREKKAAMWQALLLPDKAVLAREYRKMMDGLFGAPAREMGFPRWGMKQTDWPEHRTAGFLADWAAEVGPLDAPRVIYLTRRFAASFTSNFAQPPSIYHPLTREQYMGWGSELGFRRAGDVDRYCREYVLHHRAAFAAMEDPRGAPSIFLRYEDLISQADGAAWRERLMKFLSIATPPDAAQTVPPISYTGPAITGGVRSFTITHAGDREGVIPYMKEINEFQDRLGYRADNAEICQEQRDLRAVGWLGGVR